MRHPAYIGNIASNNVLLVPGKSRPNCRKNWKKLQRILGLYHLID
jgi:hypothetical protein